MSTLLKYRMIAIGFLFCWPQSTAAELNGFLVDVEQAFIQAEEENKDLLIDFSGSDWCGWCMRLSEEIFSQEKFQAVAKEHFVLVEMDFPKDVSGMSEETLKQNTIWQEKLSVEGFPAVFLLDTTGKPYAQTGYQAGGPERYLEHLSELRQIRIKRDELFVLADKTTAVERAKLLDSGLQIVGMDLALMAYTDEVKEIVHLDLDDEAGLRSKYQEPLMESVYRRLLPVLYKTATQDGPDAALERLEKAKQQFPVHGKLAMHLLAIKAHFLGESGRLPEAITLLDEELLTQNGAEEKVRLHYFKANLLAHHQMTPDAVLAMDAAIELTEDEQVKSQLEAFKQSLITRAQESEELVE